MSWFLAELKSQCVYLYIVSFRDITCYSYKYITKDLTKWDQEL